MTGDKKCKICRRAGEKLFLKGEKCFTPKCIFVKKPYPPGKLESEKKHRSTRSEFGSYLIEKQKVRNSYGVGEKQFSNYVKSAKEKKSASPTETLYDSLERRVDNVVFRLGLASSRPLARQLVSHGHIMVNGRKVTIPSYSVKTGDKVWIREGSRSIGPFKDLEKKLESHKTPSWIKFDVSKKEAEIVGKPENADLIFNLNSVVEFYSR
ncbi:MAG: 30S ribosomal protein S4 [Patescibacteria group bacterium]